MAASEPRFERRPEERPGELLAAALQVFSENGYRATRLDEVAARAGVSKGTVYLYFKSKEDLLLQAISRYLEPSDDSPAKVGREGPAACRLEEVLRRLWLTAHDETWAQVYRLISGVVTAEHPAVFRTWVEHGMQPVWDHLADIVRDGQSAGEFRTDISPDDLVRVFATGLMQQVYFEVHTQVRTISPADLTRMLESSLRVFLDGLRPPGAPAAG